MTWINPQKWAAETVREQKEKVRSRVARESILRKMRELYGLNWDAVHLPWESKEMRACNKRRVSVIPIDSHMLEYLTFPGLRRVRVGGYQRIKHYYNVSRQEATCPKERTYVEVDKQAIDAWNNRPLLPPGRFNWRF